MNHRCLSILLTALLATWLHGAALGGSTVDSAVLEAEHQRVAVMEKAKDAVVAVFENTGRGGGSGVVISPDGLALTNYHVTQSSGHWVRCGMANGKIYDAVLVGLDPTGDVALIKLLGRNDFPCAELGDSDAVRPGDWAFAMGNPFLLASDLQPTATYGIISGTHRYQFPSGTLLEYTDCLQTDAAVNPGNSGGPLFDAQGRLIGINGRCSFEKRGRVSVGVGYAISINQIKNFLGCLKSGRIVDHATLGFRVAADEDGRVLIDEIDELSDAYRRGARYGDEIIQFAGQPIDSPNTLKNIIGIFPKDWRLPLSYRRGGKRHDVLVRLEGLHHEGELWRMTLGKPTMKHPKMPKNHPGKKPGDEIPKDGPKPEKIAHHAAPPMPEIVKKHYTKHSGFANYFFNRQNQERLWQGWSAKIGSMPPERGWTLSGTTHTDKPFRIGLDEQGGYLELPTVRVDWKAGEDLASDLAPADSGGLLPALYLWRRLATTGLDRFGLVHYLGTAPLEGHDLSADVLVGSYGGVTCRFYFDPESQNLLAVEMFPDENTDPCEIYFSDYRSVAGRIVPGVMEVRLGSETYGRFSLETIDYDSSIPH